MVAFAKPPRVTLPPAKLTPLDSWFLMTRRAAEAGRSRDLNAGGPGWEVRLFFTPADRLAVAARLLAWGLNPLSAAPLLFMAQLAWEIARHGGPRGPRR